MGLAVFRRALSLDRRSSRLRRLILISLILALAFCATTARMFIWPPQGMPAHVNAIVMLDGPGDRIGTALTLAREHRAPVLVISLGTPHSSPDDVCRTRIAGVKLVCFNPQPATTQGEAEFAGRLARRDGWHSIVLVTTTPQDSRARLRVGRCFTGKTYVVTAPMSAYEWPYAIAYEWGATIKALVFQPNC